MAALSWVWSVSTGMLRMSTPTGCLPVPKRLLLIILLAGGGLITAACGPVKVLPQPSFPTPLVEKMPLRAGVFFSEEFRVYHHQEKRDETEWDVELGASQVPRIQRLLTAMFTDLVEVRDLSKLPLEPSPDLILEPRFEEYSFVTPRDSAGEYYAVTIKYRVNVMNGLGQLLDSFVLTGYGNTKAGGMSNEVPLALATQAAVRDAGAKFVVEFPQQAVVQKLLRGETVEPLVLPVAAPAGEIAEVAPPTAVVPVAPPATPPPVAPAATAPAPTTETPPTVETPAAAPATPEAPAPAPAPPPPPREFPDAPTEENPVVPPLPKSGP